MFLYNFSSTTHLFVLVWYIYLKLTNSYLDLQDIVYLYLPSSSLEIVRAWIVDEDTTNWRCVANCLFVKLTQTQLTPIEVTFRSKFLLRLVQTKVQIPLFRNIPYIIFIFVAHSFICLSLTTRMILLLLIFRLNDLIKILRENG